MNEDSWSHDIDPDEAPGAEFEAPETPVEEPVVHDTIFDDDGTYRIVRPESDEERSYTDASYREADDAAELPPRYYAPEPKAKSGRGEQKRGGWWKAACLALACAVLA